MNFSWAIWLMLYILIGWILADSVDKDKDDSTKLAVFITWPLIFGAFILVGVLLIIVGLTDLLLRGLFNLWESLNGK